MASVVEISIFQNQMGQNAASLNQAATLLISRGKSIDIELTNFTLENNFAAVGIYWTPGNLAVAITSRTRSGVSFAAVLRFACDQKRNDAVFLR